MPRKNWTSIFELTLAGAIWGFGFVATRWALEFLGPMQLSGLRFFVAGLTGALIWFLLNRKRFHGARGAFRELSRTVRLAVIPGLFISATLILQTWGLKYTTATKSAFITCIYVLIVPLLEPLVGGQKPSRRMWLAVLIALSGVATMSGILDLNTLWAKLSDGSVPAAVQSADSQQREQLNIGDLLTLGCAIAGAFHILSLDRLMKSKAGQAADSFALNVGQSLVAWIPPLIALVLLGEDPSRLTQFIDRLQDITDPNVAQLKLAAFGICAVTFGSTLIAFALQVRAQKSLNATVASVLFLLEGPFAAVFGALLLGETVHFNLIFGATLVIAAALLAVLKQTPQSS